MRSAGPLLSRRAVLGGALVGVAAPAVTACTEQPREPAPPPSVPPDVVAADRAVERELRLLAAYDAALVIAPQLAERLAPLRDDHAAHLAALGRPEAEQTPEPGRPGDATASPDPDAGPDAEAVPDAGPGAPPPTVAAPSLPQDPAALLGALADLERRAGLAHGSAAVRGGRGVAAVLAPLAASEASHAAALT